ncbi:type I pullulanase [Jeotgalibaca sp. A122]|uniref:type I pullulanase n=1 Tax=Jeotgalibaca sp. A122 TaxID=3457322 RepID=UPI003FCFD739
MEMKNIVFTDQMMKNHPYDEKTGLLNVTPEFDLTYATDEKLGFIFSPDMTIFRVWAPAASKIELILFHTLYGDGAEHIAMNQVAPGTYEIDINRNLDNVAYNFGVYYPDGKYTETVDPYAIATTSNGERSVVVDLLTTNPENWSERMPPFTATTDAVIYEASVRDFTMSESSGAKNRGKFLGVVEKGTKSPNGLPTGLDYLKELGITHLQLMPMYDFQTVNEENPEEKYNWGYDPQNYNVPEGSYATDPRDPKTRIREMKQMVQGLHDAGIRVIMDVVYNHVYDPDTHPFERVAPGYYFRRNEDGSMSNGTGVGNDTASEHAMMKKYILDSVKYWAQEYHIDGFRFDLMGIHDVDTMNAVRDMLDEIDPSIIVLGEGWNLNTNLPENKRASSINARQMPGIAHFNDAMRTAIKGADMGGGYDTGFISGKPFMEQWIAINQQGGLYYPQDIAGYQQPDQIVQYVEAHDNHTLFDKLAINMPHDDERTRTRRHLLASTLAMLAQGIPFIHSGQEFLRTKQGEENTYNLPDEINMIDWERRDAKQKEVTYMKELIRLRKSEPLFRMQDTLDIAKHMEVLQADYYQIVWQLENETDFYYIIFNGNGDPRYFSIEEGNFELLVHDCTVTLDNPRMWFDTDEIKVEGFSTTVLHKKK